MARAQATPSSAAGRFSTAALLALAASLAYGFWSYSYDDAFITYRYAASFAESGRLEYNPGETVLGTTAPGWALLLGSLARVSGLGVAEWGTLLSVLALLGMAYTLASALRDATPPIRHGLPLLFGSLVLTLRWNLEMWGAETLGVALLVPLGVLAALRGHGATGGVLLAAAAFCRLDASLAWVVLMPVLALRDRPAARRCLVAFSMPVVVYLIGLQLVFGAVLPNTLDAKQSEMTAALPSYHRLQWAWLLRCLPAPGAALWALALAGVPLGAAVVRWQREGSGWLSRPEGVASGVLGLWLVGHELAYRALGVPFAPWYHVPLVNTVVALAATGALILATGVTRGLTTRWRTPATVVLAAGMLLLVFRPWAYGRDSWRRPPDPRYDALRVVGEYLAREAQPGDGVAALEIGVLGAFAPRVPVLDLAGLISPEVLEARREGRLPELVAQRRPAYLVHSTLFPDVFDPLLAQSEISTRYQEVLRIPDGRGRELRLLRRRVGAP